MIEVPRSFEAASRSSTCACTVTSSAVVGSSAISSGGASAIAEAIRARWRSPPESSYGRCAAFTSGSGTPTEPSSSIAFADRLGAGAPAVQPQRLGHLVPDPAERVERDEGVLEDEADPAAAHAAPGPLGGAQQVGAGEVDPVRADPAAGAGQADQGAGGHALAGPGLADDDKAAARPGGERDALDDLGAPPNDTRRFSTRSRAAPGSPSRRSSRSSR
nr:hypothetical protein GCM10020092_037500 [Actinoplanes digitatis]